MVRALGGSRLISANHSIGFSSKTPIFLLLLMKNLKTAIILTDKNVALLAPRTRHVITAFAARIRRNYA